MLREGDSLPYLRFKQNLADTDCNAVFSNGTILPVLIRNGGSQLFVELPDYTFNDPEKLPGFARFEHKPDAQPRVEETPPVESTKITGRTWAEQKANAEKQARQSLAERYEANKAQQTGLCAPDAAFANASHQDAQINATRKGQSGPNSRL